MIGQFKEIYRGYVKDEHRPLMQKYEPLINRCVNRVSSSPELNDLLDDVFMLDTKDRHLPTCDLLFVPASEMPAITPPDQSDLKAKIRALIEKIRLSECCRSCDDGQWILASILDSPDRLLVDESGVAGYAAVKKQVDSITQHLYEECRDCPFSDNLHELVSMVSQIQFEMIALGCYFPDSDTIYICPENIETGANRSGDNDIIPDLTCAILVHEYAHCIDQRTRGGRRGTKPETIVKQDAIKETIAETVQHLYAEQILRNSDLSGWMERHSRAGLFPAWGYAGADIFNRVMMQNKQTLLKKTIRMARGNWWDAYCFIWSLNELEK